MANREETTAELHERWAQQNEQAIHTLGISDPDLSYWGVSGLLCLLKHIDQHYTLVRRQS